MMGQQIGAWRIGQVLGTFMGEDSILTFYSWWLGCGVNDMGRGHITYGEFINHHRRDIQISLYSYTSDLSVKTGFWGSDPYSCWIWTLYTCRTVSFFSFGHDGHCHGSRAGEPGSSVIIGRGSGWNWRFKKNVGYPPWHWLDFHVCQRQKRRSEPIASSEPQLQIFITPIDVSSKACLYSMHALYACGAKTMYTWFHWRYCHYYQSMIWHIWRNITWIHLFLLVSPISINDITNQGLGHVA